MKSENNLVKQIKIFFSYSTENRKEVGRINRNLEGEVFKGFLAHEDINPSREWQDEIHRNLRECDVFIPYITKKFKESKWTDQECGIAYAHSKLIIPLEVELAPYGFINKYQSLKFDPEYILSGTVKIVQTILDNKRFGDLKELIIEQFIGSKNFDSANVFSSILKDYPTFSEEEVKRISKGSFKNNQVLGAFHAQSFLKKIIDEYEKYIDLSDLSNLNSA